MNHLHLIKTSEKASEINFLSIYFYFRLNPYFENMLFLINYMTPGQHQEG